MKLYKSLFFTMLGTAAVIGATSCDSYDYSAELSSTEISDFSVKTETGTTFSARIEGDNVTVFLYPFMDPQETLGKSLPIFYLPMGATCSPSPSEVQDFSKEVKYTITSGDGKHKRVYSVNYGTSDLIGDGDGVASTMVMAEKMFTQLGYPGQFRNYDIPSEQYGDLLLSVGFCGDKLVGFSRRYAWGSSSIQPNAELAVKVWKASNLKESGTLNLGSLSVNQIVNVTNDSKGHLVAATGGLNGAQSDVYYWTSIDAAPIKVGTLAKPVYTNNHSEDAGMAIEVVGDITGDAAISYMSTRTADGQFEVAYVRGGAITNAKTITTGYPSNEGPQYFQMISLYDATENSNYLVGLSQGNAVNASIFGYYKSQNGDLLGTMGNYMHNKPFTDGVTGWINMGNFLNRGGGRRPYMMAMTINGVRYSMCLNGYAWDSFNMFMDESMSMMYYGGSLGALTHDMRKYVASLYGTAGVTTGWSYGSTGAWYWDEETHSAYVAVWEGRQGMTTFCATQYE